MMSDFGLDLNKRIKHLSRGQRAQVALALCLAPEPELLILDDPTMGLDAVVRRDFLESIIEVVHRANRTILFSSHILADVERVADRIGVIENGVLRADCTLTTFKERVRRVRCRFPAGPPETLDVPGLVRFRRIEDEAVLTIAQFDDAHLDALRAQGASEVAVMDASLEDLFIDYTAPMSGRK